MLSVSITPLYLDNLWITLFDYLGLRYWITLLDHHHDLDLPYIGYYSVIYLDLYILSRGSLADFDHCLYIDLVDSRFVVRIILDIFVQFLVG